MPSVQHLLNGSLDALREAAHRASTQDEPTRTAVGNIILGSALRLRAARAPEDQRARMYAEALEAFEAALTLCCDTHEAQSSMSAPSIMSATGTGDVNGQNGVSAQKGWAGPDGVQLVVDATTVPVPEGNEMLERAVRVFRDTCAKSNRRTALPAWFVGMSNLGAALTLLGKQTSGVAGIVILEEAVDVMHESLRVPCLEKLAAERATLQVNLASALHALADRGMPAESVRYLEDAAHWSAAALCHFAPAEYRWLLQLDRGSLS
jgi:hypothetical protein